MNTIQVYIWGVRYGFTEGTALFPERNRLTEASEIQDYDNICHYFTSAKDVAFRSGQRDFYFLMEDVNYRIYSFVDKTHQDIAGRETYLVYSIVCPKSNTISGNIKENLQNLKRLYKTRNADYSIRTNMFTNDQVRSVVSNLTLSQGSPKLPLSKSSVYYFQSDSEVNLNDFSGNEVYFLQAGSNPELLSHLNLTPQRQGLVQVNQQIQQASQKIGDFRSFLSTKTNFNAANEIYSSISSQLNNNERAAFENWKSEEKGKIELVNLKNLIDQYSKNKSKDIAPCETLIAQNKPLINGLNETEKNSLSKWRDEVEKNKKIQFDKLIEDIEFEINNAQEHAYKNSLTELEAKLTKEIEGRLSDPAKSNLINWRQNQNENTILRDVTALYSEIKKLDENNDRRAIFSRQKEWNKKINGFADRFDGKNPLNGSALEQYKYLYDGKWQRKERPIAKIAMIALVVMLTSGGFFAAMKWDNWFPKIVDVPKDQKTQTGQENGNGVDTTANGEQYTDFEHKGKVYRVEKSLLTEAGSLYNGNQRFYRYFNNVWEMKNEAPFSSKWTIAKPESDIKLILTNWNEKFKGEQPVPTPPITTPPVITPPVTTPPVTTPPVPSPPKDSKPRQTPPTEISKVTTRTLTPQQKAAKFKEIETDVRAGNCNADCIINKVREFQFGQNDQQQLMSRLP